MGLAASQARMLFITARKNDVEFSQMKIANNKISLSRDSERLSDEYNRALNARKLTWAVDGSATSTNAVDLTYNLLMTPNTTNQSGQYILTDFNNRVVLSDDYITKLGIAKSGAAGDLAKTVSQPDFLVKMMGITPADAATYVAGHTSSYASVNTTGTSPAAAMAAAQTNIQNVLNITGSIDHIGGDCPTNKATGFPVDGEYNISIPAYNALKTSIDGLVSNLTTMSKAAGTGTSDQQKYLEQMLKDAQTAQVALTKLDPNTTSSRSERMTAVSLIKELFEGTKTDDLIHKQEGPKNNWLGAVVGAVVGAVGFVVAGPLGAVGGAALGGVIFGTKKGGNDEWNSAQNINNTLTAMGGNFYKGGGSAYTGNLTDLMTTYLNANANTPVTPPITPGATLTDQNKADFYLNLYQAINGKGWSNNSNITDTSYLQNQLMSGNLNIQKLTSSGWSTLSSGDPSSPVRNIRDTESITLAESKYNSEKDKIDAKESILDLEMKNLDAERSELDTEIDSVKTIINKNIERSYKMFQG